MSQISTKVTASSLGAVTTLTPNSGGAIGPNGSGTIFVPGGTNITTTGAGNTVTIGLSGVVAVPNGGTGDATLTAHGVLIGEGTSPVNVTSAGTNGQVLIGSTAADPAFSTLTSTGGTIIYTTGAHTLNLEVSGATSSSFPTDSGTAVPALGALTVHGGSNITTSGAGSTVTVNVAGTTNHAVQIGNSGASLTSLGVGTNGQVLIGSTAADPAFASLTSSGSTITFTPGSNTLNLESVPDTITGDSGGPLSPTAHNFNIVGGTNIATSGAGSTLTVNLVATVPVSLGGTGRTTLTSHGVLVGETTSAINQTAAGTNGQVLIGATGADPAFATLTSTGGSITFTTGANTLNLEAAGGGGGGMSWSVVTGTTQTLTTTKGYFANNAGTVTFTLPATAAVGDSFGVSGMNNATGWTIAQNSGQTIHFGTFNTTTGVGGSLSSTAIYDTLVFICNVTNTDFVVIQSIGNITVV